MNLSEFITNYNMFCENVTREKFEELRKSLIEGTITLTGYDLGILNLFKQKLETGLQPTNEDFSITLSAIEELRREGTLK